MSHFDAKKLTNFIKKWQVKDMSFSSSLLALLILTLGTQTLAYTSPFYMIYKKIAQKHGKSAYELLQYTTFPTTQGVRLSVSEKWLVLDENHMLVHLKASFKNSPLEAQILYTPEGRFFLNDKNKRQRLPRQDARIEPFFHFRKKSKFYLSLIRLNLIPSYALLKPPLAKDIDKITYTRESFVKLKRFDGKVSYFVSTNKKKTGLWIEQDQFLVQKVAIYNKTSHDKTILAKNYVRYARNFHFPKIREVLWKDKQIHIQLKKIKPLKSSQVKKKLLISSLKKPNTWAGLNDLKYFYLYER